MKEHILTMWDIIQEMKLILESVRYFKIYITSKPGCKK